MRAIKDELTKSMDDAVEIASDIVGEWNGTVNVVSHMNFIAVIMNVGRFHIWMKVPYLSTKVTVYYPANGYAPFYDIMNRNELGKEFILENATDKERITDDIDTWFTLRMLDNH